MPKIAKNGGFFYEITAITLIGYNGERENIDLTIQYPLFERTAARYPNARGENPLVDKWLWIFNQRESNMYNTLDRLEKMSNTPIHWVDARFSYRPI